MVQRIITLCDVCYDEGDENTEGTSHFVAVAGGSWSLELCDPHRDRLIRPLADVAERLGQAVRADGTPWPRAARAPRGSGVAKVYGPPGVPCVICGAAFTARANMTTHMTDVHGHDGLTGVYGLTCPLCTHESANGPAASGHVRRAHPEVDGGMPEAFRFAYTMGDPHGIVAKRLADLGVSAPHWTLPNEGAA
jgi:hypothetical protein